MAVGLLPVTLTEANDKPLQTDVRFWTDRKRSAGMVLADASAWLTGTGGSIAMTVGNGRIVLNSNIAGLRVAKVDMQALPAGSYDIEVQGVDTNGGVTEIRGSINLLAGLG